MEDIVFWGFNLHAWITIVTVLTMFSVLLFTKLRADLVFLGAMAILYVTGVLNVKDAFSGFSSTSVLVVGVLFVVVAGLTYTGVLQWIMKNLLGQPDGYAKVNNHPRSVLPCHRCVVYHRHAPVAPRTQGS